MRKRWVYLSLLLKKTSQAADTIKPNLVQAYIIMQLLLTALNILLERNREQATFSEPSKTLIFFYYYLLIMLILVKENIDR